MGHRARGLQRRRRGVGLLPPRPCALASLPLERGRPRRHLRLPPAPVLRALAVERPRPVPQGEDVRPDGGRGEPRRGRQGLLLLRRLDADALVHEVPLQVPAGRVPLRPARRGEPRPGQDAAGVRAGRHRDLRRVALLRRRRGVRQGRGRRHPGPHQRQQPRPGGGADRGAADALVPQHLELGARRPPPAKSRREGETPCSPRTGTSASTPSTAPAPTSCSSPRTRRTPRGCTASRRRPPGSRTPSTRASWAAGATPSIRRPPERRPPRAMHVQSAPARRSRSSCAWLQ